MVRLDAVLTIIDGGSEVTSGMPADTANPGARPCGPAKGAALLAAGGLTAAMSVADMLMTARASAMDAFMESNPFAVPFLHSDLSVLAFKSISTATGLAIMWRLRTGPWSWFLAAFGVSLYAGVMVAWAIFWHNT